jgi:DNA-binding response OmpR family regulator
MRLIIVDDESELAEILKKQLELKGFAVDWLPSADKAFNRILLYQKEYDAVILDLNMMGMNGMELTKKLRAENVKLPILIVTGDSSTQTKIALLNSGADDYVVKPFSLEELIARLNSVLRRPATPLPTTLSAGSITMNTGERTIKVNEKEVALSLKEYALLECFVRHPGEVMTREQLSNKVWDFAALTLSNVLDVHMVSLRKKIAGKDDSTRFETVRGIGYRLVV